jgi:cytochrome c biogenesis protein CcmG, thiol:disulfide interchange protein DsbE
VNRRIILLAPFAAVVAAGAGFFAMLKRETEGRFDPRGVPSMLINKPVPGFSLPGEPGFGSTDLRGRAIVVNWFASWCLPCAEEAAVLMSLKQAGVPLYGIAYKDAPAATAAYLTRHGDPYARLAADRPGRVAIDWGLTGVPETYLIDADGIVRWRYVGPLTPDAVTAELQPLLHRYA